MDRYAYYVCFKCGKAYFGGEARCDLEAGAGDAFNPEELVCGGCSDVSQVNFYTTLSSSIPQYKSQDPENLINSGHASYVKPNFPCHERNSN